MKSPTKILFLCLLSILLLMVSGCTPQTVVTSQIVTVVHTVPVEVTRLVEVVSTVEVEREVIVTQIVEIPVTLTPMPSPEGSPTPEPSPTLVLGPTYTPGGFVPADYDPNEKKPGFAPLKVINETGDRMGLTVTGARAFAIIVSGNSSVTEIVPEGEFFYTAWRDERIAYQGSFRVTNPDKHELVLREDKAVFRVP